MSLTCNHCHETFESDVEVDYCLDCEEYLAELERQGKELCKGCGTPLTWRGEFVECPQGCNLWNFY